MTEGAFIAWVVERYDLSRMAAHIVERDPGDLPSLAAVPKDAVQSEKVNAFSSDI